ncbi:hypothetical protein [Streptomyces sp. SPB074]|uniref:hypothetical protein n=1 Tax=Streptomyces sp. (strain SPB074) TaxID=465543 RepID=UPI00017F1EC9|nr:hypothetical protein [Streptomyces sp. SPB074]EDY44849.2 integral membrane protein [Streptomyces sp. SPB074]
MSTGDDHRYGVPPLPDDYGGTGQTRTRLPDRATPPRGATPRRSSRGLVVIGAVVALLIAAIAFANRHTDDSPTHPDTTNAAKAPAPAPTTPTGTKPTQSHTPTGIPTGYPHTKEGAQSAAANYAVALASEAMLTKERREQLLAQLLVKDQLAPLKQRFDSVYSAAFLAKIGLDPQGSPVDGGTYVSRAMPVGTKTTAYADNEAKVEVWCTSLSGTASKSTTHPVTTTWYTTVLTLRWEENDWRIAAFTQKDGPTPVNGDGTVSTSEEIEKAVEEYGGFTYAR